MKKNLPFIFSVLLASSLVGIYQLPTIENTLNKYGMNLNVNDSYPYARNFQQSLEDSKITLSSNLEETVLIELEPKKETKIIAKAIVKPVIEQPTIVKTEPVIKEPEVIIVKDEGSAAVATVIPEPVATINVPTDISTQSIDLNNPTASHPPLPCEENCKVLMLGDSVMGDVSFALQRLLHKEKPSWKVIDAHKVSSGLSNQNYYNWPATANKLIEENRPDYTLILIGTNDAQNFTSNGKGHAFGKDTWKEQYALRVEQMISLFNITNWSWIELPVVNDSKFNDRLEVIRQLQNDSSKEHYLGTKSIFDKRDNNGSVDMKLRAGDGIHLNSNGANLLAKYIVSKKFYIEVVETKKTSAKKS